MELHQLRYFVAVAEIGSFTRAAERCGVAQPSLSQQIHTLEEQLDQRLFDRLGRQVRLTEAGEELLGRAQAILAAVDEAERALREGGAPGKGRLSVGAIPTVAPYLLPPVVSSFLRRYPEVELQIREDFTDRLVAALLSGELDVAVMALPMTDTRLVSEVLLKEPLLLTLPRDHRLAEKDKVRLDELRHERFILLSEMHCLGEQVASFCRQRDFVPQVACRTAQLSTIQRLISLGMGVSLLPALARDVDRDSSRIYRELAGHAPSRTLGAVWHRQRYQSPTLRLFVQQLRAQSAE